MLCYIFEQKKVGILFLAILYYVSSLIVVQSNSNSYLLKINEPLKKLRRTREHKIETRGVKNFMDFSFVSKNETKEKEPHADKEKKEENKSLKLGNEEKKEEKKNDKEKKPTKDETEESLDGDEEESDEEKDSIKKKGKEKDKKDEGKNGSKKKPKDEDDDEDEDDEGDEEGEEENDEEEEDNKKKKNKDHDKKKQDTKKGNEANGEHHEENKEKDKKQKSKEGEKNNTEGKESTENSNHHEQNPSGDPNIPNVAQSITPIIDNSIPPKKDEKTTHEEKDEKLNEDIHIPENVKNNFMKLLRSVVEVNSKNDLNKKENTNFKETENKKQGTPSIHDKINGNELHNTLSHFNKIIEHFKKYMIYYVAGIVIFFVFAVVMQCSDVSNKRKKKNKDIKKDRSKISNYRRDVHN